MASIFLNAEGSEGCMVKIISDSTCDLSGALFEQYGVELLPLHILLDEDDRLDRTGITPEEIFTWSDAHRATPKTAAFSVDEARQCFKPYLDAGENIMCFSISASMSASYQNMRLAAAELNAEDRVCVIDSQNLSTGVGLQVIEAAIMAQQGASLREIEQHILRIRPLVRASFVVDTLTYLHRGGRCSSVSALAGSALRLHPRIAVIDGAMAAGKKYRGKLAHVIDAYVRDMEADLLRARPERVFITHSGCSREIVEDVRAYLTGLHHFDEVLETRAGGVISSHCGPGTLGVLYIAGDTVLA